MSTVTLGNSAPIDTNRPNPATDEYERIPIDVPGAVTTYVIPSDVSLVEAIKTITDTFNAYHSDDTPGWVESDDVILAEALAQHYNCLIGRPADSEETP